MKKDFRIVNSFDEVVGALAACLDSKLSFLLWQNTPSGRKQVLCSLLSFSQSSNVKVILEIPKDFEINSQLDFFIYQESLNFLFKGSFSLLKKNELTLVIDNKLYLKENRQNSRFVF